MSLSITLPRKPKAVVFDMDGLLIDTIPAYVSAMVVAGDDVGYAISKAYVLSLVGLLGTSWRHSFAPILVRHFRLQPT